MDTNTELLRERILRRGKMPQAVMEEVLHHFRPLEVEKQAHLVRKGAVAHSLYFIERGLVRTYLRHGRGETTRFIAQEGDFVTSLGSLVYQTPADDYVQALEDSQLWYIEYHDLLRLADKHHAWERFCRLLTQEHLVISMRRMNSLLAESAMERYERLEREQPGLLQRLPQYYIASYLGIEPQSLSRLRGARAAALHRN